MKRTKLFALVLISTIFIWRCDSNTNTIDLLNGNFIDALSDTTAPNVLAPINGSVVGLDVILQWTAKAGATTYLVDVATDAAFASPITGSPFTINAPDTTYNLTLTEGNTYYWRVAANTTTPGQYGQAGFDALDSIVYVYCPPTQTTCSDTGAIGHIANPFQTISGGLAEAARLGKSEVRVAARDTVGTAYQEVIALKDGISLYGGYSPDFATRDIALYQTVVSSNTSFVVFAQNIFRYTVVDGFIFINTSTGLDSSYGIKTDNCSSMLIFHNITVNGGSGANSYGMYNINGSTPQVTNSTITTGNSTVSATGVYNDATSLAILDSSTTAAITTGTAPTTIGIGIQSTADTSPPNILAPTNASTVTLAPILQWTSKNGATTYTIDIATDAAFISPLAGSPFTVSAPTTTFDLSSLSGGGLPGGGTYYWRVAADTTVTGQYGQGNFTALAAVIYVYCPSSVTTCSDVGAQGTITNPFQTINGGIAEAFRLGKSDVYIASRGSTGNTSYQETVVLKDGINVHGGYNSTFSGIPDTIANPVTITSTGNYVAYVRDVFRPTTIDGIRFVNTSTLYSSTIGIMTENSSALLNFVNVYVNGGTGSLAYGMYNSNYSQFTLTGSTVTTGNTSVRSVGVYNDLGSIPTIVNSTITTGISNSTIGIMNAQGSSSGALISNSEILPANAQVFSAGVSGNNETTGGDVTITQSLIKSGNVVTGASYAIHAENGTITNNEIVPGTGSTFAGVYLCYAAGVKSVIVTGNLIKGPAVSSPGAGIFLCNDNVIDSYFVQNNTIEVSGVGSTGVELQNNVAATSSLSISNNIIYNFGQASSATGIKTGAVTFTAMDKNLQLGMDTLLSHNTSQYVQACSALNTQGTGTYGYGSGGGTSYITKDGGNTNINSLGFGTSDVNDIYVNGSTIILATAGAGLSISTDGGATWTIRGMADGLGYTIVYDIFVSGSNVYAATANGLSISTNGGVSFVNKTPASGGLGGWTVYGVAVSGSTIYAATNNGLSISTNGGASFVNRTTIDGLLNNQVNGVFVVGANVYAATGGGLSISTNSGTSFTTNITTATAGFPSNTVNKVYVTGSYIYTLHSGTGVGVSTNSGTTWTTKNQATNGLASNWVKDLYASGTSLYVAGDGGLSYSSNAGTTFTNLAPGIISANGIYISGNIYLATLQGYASSATGYSLITSQYGLESSLQGVYAEGNNVYVADSWNGVSVSYDGGATFTNKTTANGLLSNRNAKVTGGYGAVYVVSSSPAGLSVSSDNGATWGTATGLGSTTIKDIYIDGTTTYVSTTGGLSVAPVGSLTFTNKTTANGLGNNTVNKVFVSGSTVYAATAGGLSISTNGGNTFSNRTTANGLGNNSINDVFVSNNKIYAATTNGLSTSLDGGNVFINATTTGGSGLSNNAINRVIVNGSFVYAIDGNFLNLDVSIDGGVSFSPKMTGQTINDIWVWGQNVYLVRANGFSVSVDGGLTFTQKSTTIFSQIFMKGNNIYLLTYRVLYITNPDPCTTVFSAPLLTGNAVGASTAATFAAGFDPLLPSTWNILGSGPADLDASGGWTTGDIGADTINAGVPPGITPGAL